MGLRYPKVFYTVPERMVTCLYCNIQYTRDKQYQKKELYEKVCSRLMESCNGRRSKSIETYSRLTS